MRCAHFSFGALGADRSWELPRGLNSMQDRRAVRKQQELAGVSLEADDAGREEAPRADEPAQRRAENGASQSWSPHAGPAEGGGHCGGSLG